MPTSRLARSIPLAVTTLALLAPALSARALHPELHGGPGKDLFESAIVEKCIPPAAYDRLRTHGDAIATAPTLEAARAMVLDQTRLARRALRTASWLLPFSGTIRKLEDDIATLERRTFAAATQHEVSTGFLDALAVPPRAGTGSEAMAPLLVAHGGFNAAAVTIGGGGECHYTTAEVIVIIIGFILFIIPGIIFLILLC